MKKILTLTCFLLFISGVKSQDFNKLPQITLEGVSDYSEHEELVLECADYLLKHDVDYQKRNRAFATQFLMRWMTGSEITFEIGSDFVKYSDKDGDRTAVYLASLISVVLHGEEGMTTQKVDEKTEDMFLSYCAKFSHLKRNKVIKKELKKRSSS